MCGIGGWLGPLDDGDDVARRMMARLIHRGPDAQALRRWPEATLVHTRLSILDLSAAGAQPMSNEDGTVWTVFNGEIYNHRALRKGLEERGHRFRGHADTEVLPHLYEDEGPAFLTRLRGMFTLAIYDTRNHRLLLARDRFGIKPLFFAPGERRLAFASELNALREVPDIDTRPNRQAIDDFTALSYVPAPETFFQGIRCLSPCEFLEASLEAKSVRWRTDLYHRWSVAPDFSLAMGKAVDKADELLQHAVGSQLESDVPLGTLLSGGIDSSLVSAFARQQSGGNVQTFNVQFSDPHYDETWAALAVAHHIDSRHQTLTMEERSGSWETVTELLRHAGQPFADNSLFGVHAVCQLMRRHVTVALSGDGGDEAFGGYHFFWQIRRIAALQRLPRLVWRAAPLLLGPLAAIGLVSSHIPGRFKDLGGADDTAVIQSILSAMQVHEQDRLCRNQGLLPVRRLFEPRGDYTWLDQKPRQERLSAHITEVLLRLVLPNDFLFKVDTASMRASLEVRVPMLDEDLVAFGLTLPHHLKEEGRKCKRVLRAVAARYLPRAVALKEKKGFGVPVAAWVNEEFKTRLSAALLGPESRLPEFFHPEVYRPWIQAFGDDSPCSGVGREALHRRVLILLAVHLNLENAG